MKLCYLLNHLFTKTQKKKKKKNLTCFSNVCYIRHLPLMKLIIPMLIFIYKCWNYKIMLGGRFVCFNCLLINSLYNLKENKWLCYDILFQIEDLQIFIFLQSISKHNTCSSVVGLVWCWWYSISDLKPITTSFVCTLIWSSELITHNVFRNHA